jgi:hypothetical protein
MIAPGGRHIDSPDSQRYREYGGWKLHLTVRPENYSRVVPNLIRKGEYRDILHLTNIRLRELLGYSTQHLL